EDPEELLVVGRVRLLVVVRRRLLLDHDDDVLQVLPKRGRHLRERLLDDRVELLRRKPGEIHRRKRSSKLAVVAAATVARSVFLTSASFLAVSTTKAGSQGRPRCGTGARKGVSVSTRSASRGSAAAASRMLSAGRNVIIPEKEMR